MLKKDHKEKKLSQINYRIEIDMLKCSYYMKVKT